jgi:nucleoside-diphosphate-sugar epimerase
MTPRDPTTDSPITVLAGATGNLGGRIAEALLDRGGAVRAIVRRGSPRGKVDSLRKRGADVISIDFDNFAELAEACAGASCVVSALAGLRDVIVEAQTSLLHAAITVGVPRFIPSDYAIDFPKLPDGRNRNLDLRREFHGRLDKAPIAATSILSGMFTDMLTGQAPIVLPRVKRVVYWGDADQLMDFTTVDDTARFTAAAALDQTTPRFLRIAGDVISARGLMEIASDVFGARFRLFRAGGLGRFEKVIKLTRFLAPGDDELYPPWQGMQYLRDMLDGRAKLTPLDNDRYGPRRWTTAQDVLEGMHGRER